jgi:hypothetical protein
MASPQYLEYVTRLKRPSLSAHMMNPQMMNAQMSAQVDRRRQDRADNVFTQIEDVTYAVLRRHTKSA